MNLRQFIYKYKKQIHIPIQLLAIVSALGVVFATWMTRSDDNFLAGIVGLSAGVVIFVTQLVLAILDYFEEETPCPGAIEAGLRAMNQELLAEALNRVCLSITESYPREHRWYVADFLNSKIPIDFNWKPVKDSAKNKPPLWFNEESKIRKRLLRDVESELDQLSDKLRQFKTYYREIMEAQVEN